jgi:hypothetical protein
MRIGASRLSLIAEREVVMSEVCNTIAALDANAVEEKASLGWTVSIAIHAALSNCYKAVETVEINGGAIGAEAVYLHAAVSKLETAAQALRRMREILTEGSLSDEAIAWFKALDYDRLYMVGTRRGQIPAVVEQWNRLVELKIKSNFDHLAVADRLIDDVEHLRRKTESVVGVLSQGTSGAPLTVEQAEQICCLQTELVQFSTFTQMVGYLNAVEPLDMSWCRNVELAEYPHVDLAGLGKRNGGARFLVQ